MPLVASPPSHPLRWLFYCLNTMCYIYFARDSLDVILYIGITSRPEQRLKKHRYAQWYPFCKQIEFVEVASRELAWALETHFILSEKPPFNRNKTRWFHGDREHRERYMRSAVTHSQPAD